MTNLRGFGFLLETGKPEIACAASDSSFLGNSLKEGRELKCFLKNSNVTVTQGGTMGGGKLGTIWICAYTTTKKTAEIKPHLSPTIDSHALSVRLCLAS